MTSIIGITITPSKIKVIGKSKRKKYFIYIVFTAVNRSVP